MIKLEVSPNYKMKLEKSILDKQRYLSMYKESVLSDDCVFEIDKEISIEDSKYDYVMIIETCDSFLGIPYQSFDLYLFDMEEIGDVVELQSSFSKEEIINMDCEYEYWENY